jgi:hypothetical protein
MCASLGFLCFVTPQRFERDSPLGTHRAAAANFDRSAVSINCPESIQEF